MHLSKRTAFLIGLACTLPAMASCGSQESERGPVVLLEGYAWLGSAEGWGLLGFQPSGGPLAYRSAETLESPTWAPPDLESISQAWRGEDAVWLQFSDSRIGRYDYATGHLLSFEDYETTDIAVALEDASGLVVGAGEGAVELVAEAEPWHFELGGRLMRLVAADDGRVVAVVDAGSGSELLVLEPPGEEPLGRRDVGGVRDLAITAWGERLYYLSGDEADLALHGLTLPGLEDADDLPLPEPGRSVAVTPSGHRIYVAVGDSLHVFDRLRGERVRSVALPGAATSLRFSLSGAYLLARLEGEDRVVVLGVGVDSIMGVIDAGWSDNLPAALPGGRLIVADGGDLVLYDVSRLVEVSRVEADEARLWLAVEWQPPRPRLELAQRSVRRSEEGSAASSASREADEDLGSAEADTSAQPGYYAVVLAARERAGVDNLVRWLRSVGYPGTVDRHVDVMGVTWFRAMVGPYPDRVRGEESARSLSARYGYKPWILSIAESEVEDSAAAESPDEEGEGPGGA